MMKEESSRKEVLSIRNFLKNAPTPLIVFDLKSKQILDANQIACDFFGYEFKEFIKLPLRSLFKDEWEVNDYLNKVNKPPGSWTNFLSSQIHRDGEDILFEVQSTKLVLQKRSVIICLLRDVSKTVYQQDEIEEESQRSNDGVYQQLVELSPMMIALLRQDKLFYMNQAGLNYLGLESKENVIGHSIKEFIHPDHRNEILRKFISLLRAGKKTSFIEHAWVRPDGNQIELELSVILAELEPVPILHIMAQDISERKRSEKVLQRQASLAELELTISRSFELTAVLEEIIQNTRRHLQIDIGSCICIWDKESQTFSLGSSSIQHPDEDSLVQSLLDRNSLAGWVMDNKKAVLYAEDQISPPVNLDYFINYHIHTCAAIPLMVENEVFGVFFILSSSLRELTVLDFHYLQSLANRAGLAITRVRLYETLQQAKQAAEDAAQTKGMFLANASHELRTPLTALVTLSELLRESDLSESQRRYVEAITTSAERLLTLTNDILDLSKIEAMKFELDERPYELRSIVENVLEQFSASADKKNLLLAYDMQPDVPEIIFSDPLRLSQILTNLVHNGLKNTDDGHVVVNVSLNQNGNRSDTKSSNKTKRVLIFEVQDTGIGIPPDRLEKVFNTFTQLEVPSTQVRQGTGLGLAICKQIVELMKGHIWVESDGILGEGSNFKFTLPILPISRVRTRPLQKKERALKGKRVLIASQNTVITAVVNRYLRNWSVSSGEINTISDLVHHLAESEQVDAIILDQRLLNADSAYLNQIVESISKIPVILLSTSNNISSMRLLANVVGELKNPIMPDKVSRLLLDLFSISDREPISSHQINRLPVHEKLRLIVAEDDPTVNRALVLRLQSLGYDPESVTNGLELVNAFERNSYDVVLVDIYMPEINGLSAIQYLRDAFPEKLQPYIIAMTADTQNETLEKIIQAGGDDIMIKPFLGSEIVDAFNKYKQETDRKLKLQEKSSVPDQSQDEVLDKNVLQDFLDLMGENADSALEELLDLYLTHTPSLIKEINSKTYQEDWIGLKSSVHALKGNGVLFGATRLVQLCSQLEFDLQHGKVAEIVEQVHQIGLEYHKLSESIADLKMNLPVQSL